MDSKTRSKSTEAALLATALFFLAMLCLLAVWTAAPLFAGGEDPPDLSGHWEMDQELSEDPMEKMRESRGGMRGGGGFGGRGGGGFGGGRGGGFGGGRGGMGGGPGRGSGDRPSREEMQQRMEEMRKGYDRLTIVQADSQVRIAFADGREQVLTTDNKKQVLDTPFGEVEVKARWRDAGLVVNTRGERRSTTETYYVTEDGSLLTVMVEMDPPGSMGPVSFKRIYRPYDPEEIEDEDGETATEG